MIKFFLFLKHSIANILDSIFYYFGFLLPIKSNWVLFFSVPDFSDNAFALFEYIYNRDAGRNFRFFWFVEDKQNVKCKDYNCTIIYKDSFFGYGLKKFVVMSMSKYLITDHHFWLSHKKGQLFVLLCHGTPLKAPKGYTSLYTDNRTIPDLVTSTSDLSTKLLSKFLYLPHDKFRPLGYPRNDYFFQRTEVYANKVYSHFKISSGKKILFWMPTFRQSSRVLDCSECYLESETGLPFFSTEDELRIFDAFLEEIHAILFFKIHPLQQTLPIFGKKFKNILIIQNDILGSLHIQLYQLLHLSDVLITDYSSISYDYLLLNRPMIFTIDDIEQYQTSRGFIMDDPLNYMPGYHVNNWAQFKNALKVITTGHDIFKEAREDLSKRIYLYSDGKSSERIAKYIGIFS